MTGWFKNCQQLEFAPAAVSAVPLSAITNSVYESFAYKQTSLARDVAVTAILYLSVLHSLVPSRANKAKKEAEQS